MILEEYFNYRNELLDQSKDDEGFHTGNFNPFTSFAVNARRKIDRF